MPREIDVLDSYLTGNKEPKRNASSKQQQPGSPVESLGPVEVEELDTRAGRSSRVFPGARINLLEVLGQEVRQGRYRPVTRSKYRCRCLAKSGPDGAVCGAPVTYGYQQLYYENVYSCGCTPRPKHPPIRLENRRFGRVTVLRWALEEGAWELACEECGKVFYRKDSKAVEQAGESCEGHAE